MDSVTNLAGLTSAGLLSFSLALVIAFVCLKGVFRLMFASLRAETEVRTEPHGPGDL